MKLGDLLHQERRRLGLKQAEVAEKVGVHPKTLSKWERNKVPVSAHYAGKLERALGMRLINRPPAQSGPTMPDVSRLSNSQLITLQMQCTAELAHRLPPETGSDDDEFDAEGAMARGLTVTRLSDLNGNTEAQAP